MLWLQFTVFSEKHKKNHLLLLNPKLHNQFREKALSKIMLFPIVIEQTTKELKPHTLCVYLYELATNLVRFTIRKKLW